MGEVNVTNKSLTTHKTSVVPLKILYPFILVTSLFALWGFANDITNPMVKAFSKILLMSNSQGALVQFAFYGGYCVMAIPAALFIKRFTYKSGILVGLALYAIGALLFIPAGHMMAFWAFLLSYFILTCGLSFLETSSNPYVLAMGPEESSTRRLNLSQAFNPIGSLLGMFTAQQLILARLNPASTEERAAMTPEAFNEIAVFDLGIMRGPYVTIGIVVLIFFVIFLISKLPKSKGEEGTHLNLGPTLRRLFSNKKYIEGVIAQAFYVGAQIMCWTFIIHYGTELFTSEAYGMTEQQSEVLSQKYNIVAMIIFCISRFVCTFLLKYFNPGGLLMSLAIGGFGLILGTIFSQGILGLYCLVGTSACMSLMFPTIYGIALKGLGDDAKLGAAGLIMAIGGGSVMPLLQGMIIDKGPFSLGFLELSGSHASFVLPLLCFVVITIFGFRTSNVHGHRY